MLCAVFRGTNPTFVFVFIIQRRRNGERSLDRQADIVISLTFYVGFLLKSKESKDCTVYNVHQKAVSRTDTSSSFVV